MSTKGLLELPKDAAEWLVTNKPKAAIETLIEQAEEIASLQRERDAAYQAGLEAGAKDKADAERYRWLREGDNDEAVMLTYDATVRKARKFDPARDGSWLLRKEELDAAIDAAMKKEHP